MTEPTLTGLRVVAAVADTGSFRAAAEKLGYTQSAVSRQVASVEHSVGMALFERYARGVHATAAGDVMIRHANRVLEDLAGARLELAGLKDRLDGRLSIGAFPTAAAVLVPRAVATLKVMHPAVDVRLVEASTPAQLRALRRDRLQVAIVAVGDGLPDYDLSGLAMTELHFGLGIGVAVPRSHPLAARDWVAPEELRNESWIVGAGPDGEPQFGAWPGSAEPRISFKVRDWWTRLGMVGAGLGIALVPGSAAEAIPRTVRWVRIDDTEGTLHRTAYAATPEEVEASGEAFVRVLVQEAARA